MMHGQKNIKLLVEMKEQLQNF